MITDNIVDIYELTPIQQGILFHSIQEPESGMYVQQLGCVLEGNLRIGAFERAWKYVIERHPTLRTSFHWEELDKPLQVVQQEVDLPLAQYDWRHVSPDEQKSQLEDVLTADYLRGFDLSQAPLLRLTLIRLGETHYHFIWSYHHLLLDGVSLSIVLRELFTSYEAICQGRPLSLGYAHPYRNYIDWFQQQDLSRGEAFWRQQLKGATALTSFAVDHIPTASAKEYGRQPLRLSTEMTGKLRELVRQQSVTLNTVVQACWALLLSRYTAQSDIIFGSVMSTRPADLVGVDTIVGLCINTLPVRIYVDDRQTVGTWLRQLQEQQAELRQYEHTPLVQVQQWSEVPRGQPLFESILVFKHFLAENALHNVEGNLKILDTYPIERNNYPLTLSVVAAAGSDVLFQIDYDCRRFDSDVIKRMAGHYQTLLEGLIADPTRRLSELPLLTEEEYQQQVVAWNATKVSYPDDQCLHYLFEKQVQLRPQATAVICEQHVLTYEQLNRQANQLAHYLRSWGVGPEVRVGLCVERSAEMIVGAMGILKAGGAYVPMDPTYPQERLAYLLEDSTVPLLVTQQRLLPRLPEHRARVVCLDGEQEVFSRQSEENPVSGVTAENLAYMIYTSGSTGRPKGVLLNHHGRINNFYDFNRRFGVHSEDRLLTLASLSFDMSTYDMFGILAIGGTVVTPRAEVERDPAAWADIMLRHQITVWHSVPSLLEMYINHINHRPELYPRSLRVVLLGGDWIPVTLPDRMKAIKDDVQIVGLGGVTEVSMDSTTYLIDRRDPTLKSIPYGCPIANTEAYVLDKHLNLAPIGVAGEMYLGGVGLARGYLNRGDLSAERFIPHPFSRVPGSRLYKTGDLALYLPDGNLELLGRIDFQVKIRGYRIELGEIEVALRQHPAVQESLVIVREDVPGDKRLVAYIVLKRSVDVDAKAATQLLDDIRRRLRAALPSYMVPGAFVLLETLPLTPNSKVDRRALPAPSDVLPARDKAFVAPRTSTEEMLVDIWTQVLGIARVSVNDSFFDLGGHSLLATQIMARIRTTFSLDIPLRSLFDTPTIAGLARSIEVAQSRKHGLLISPLVPQPIQGNPPLSFAQQRLWFIDQLTPNDPVYNISVRLQLTGRLDVTALENSLNEVIRRHQIMRTTFVMENGHPVQVIAASLLLPLYIIDLRTLSEEERNMTAEHLATEEAQLTFDLTRGPLVRAGLVCLDRDEYILLLTIHHIICDGWSFRVLIEEVASLYTSFASHTPMQLPELSIQYADYALWQRNWLQGDILEQQLKYWKTQLDGAPPLLEIPSSHSRPPVQTYRGAQSLFTLPYDLRQGLKELSQQEGVTLFMTLLAAFQILLARYTGQTDIVIGMPIANRTHAELEQLVGFFVNMLVIRVDLSDNPSVQDLLKRVRDAAMDAYTHQDLPFEQLVEAMQPERNLSYAPLFQIAFAFQNIPPVDLVVPDLTVRQLDAVNLAAQADLNLVMWETPENLCGALQFNVDLFEETTIKRLVGHYQQLLEGLLADPTQLLSELPLLNEEEYQRQVVTWNATQADYPDDQCLHSLFERQVQLRPQASALMFEQHIVTYEELNRRANQLAHYLQSQGVGPDVRVGLCVERSVEMIVGVLGILKAGGAYVPMDPTYPQERFAYLLEDSAVSLLLTQQGVLPKLPEHRAHVICLDGEQEVFSQQCEENPVSGATPENLAYIIYTSGSTGRPKGAMITHRAITARVTGLIDIFGLDASHKQMQFVSLSFDISVEEIFPTLSSGASLLLSGASTKVSTLELLSDCQRYGVTKLNPPVAYWHQLVNDLMTWKQLVPETLKLLVTGGESPSLARLKEWVHLLQRPSRFLNVWGTTETTILATIYESPMEQEALDRLSTLPIGRPIANTQIYILDEQFQPVPFLVTGELYIGGEGLGRGYLNQPALTAERFVPNPFSAIPGARLYRTGDLGRYLADGTIEFLGRRDHQVKLRGFRIELGEIEVILEEHSAVSGAVVMIREEVVGDKRLLAYVVSKIDEKHVLPDELKRYLGERLPDYMVPSVIIVLDAFPLTPNGKVDRRALPDPGTMWVESEVDHVAPRSQVEEIVAAICATVLNVEKLGMYDNFFELGGNSLHITQIISRLRMAFQMEIPMQSVLKTPNVAGLAKQIEEIQRVSLGLQSLPLLPAPRDQHIPLSFAQQRLWFIEQLEPGNSLYNTPAYVRLRGSLDITVLQCSISEIVRRHEVLRTTFVAEDGQAVQVIQDAALVLLPVIDVSGLSGEEREAEAQRLAQADVQMPFDLSVGPLLRVQLVRLHEREHVMLVTMHHIITDGWSMGILLEEVSTLYTAFVAGQPSPLPDLPIQYADFAVWQRAWFQGEMLNAQLAYWKTQLADAPTVLELPTDRARPAVKTYHGAHHVFALPEALSQGLNVLSRQEGVTLFMTLLAGFQVLLARYTGVEDLVIGVPIANRNRVETEALIGFFVNTLVLRGDLRENPSFRELLARTRAVALGAYAHQDLPFEVLVEALQPKRSLSHSPLFQIMFVLQNQPVSGSELPGIQMEPMLVESSLGKFDMTLSMVENGSRLEGTLEYDTDLFDASTISHFIQHFEVLLKSMQANSDAPLSELSLLSTEERTLILDTWTATETAYPRERCLQDLFAEQVARQADAIALVCGEQQITYQELNLRANFLARQLQQRGVGPEVPVGICMERSLNQIIGLLGILKAGGAYVAVDPHNPVQRMLYIFENAQIKVLLTQHDLLERLPELAIHAPLCLDSTWYEGSQEERDLSPVHRALSDNLAYIAYTSGSTGEPKGVGIQQKSVVRLIKETNYMSFSAQDVFLQFVPISFDVSSLEIWGCLLNGARLVIAPAQNPSLYVLAQLIERQQITTAWLTSGLFHQMVDYHLDCLLGLKQLLAGGDVLSVTHVQKFLAQSQECMLINGYGPTENATFTSCYTMTPGMQVGSSVSIGRPIANTQIYILDEQFQPVPFLVTGELYIGGEGLGRGYLNQPALTAERFMPNPFSAIPGARLYRTGDLGRYLADGTIEFLGRRDHQVKLRGFRIELGEIEVILEEHSAVSGAVVMIREEVVGDKRLLAYVVSKIDEKHVLPDELKRYLGERLPDYMVPSVIIVLDAFPLTPNGKVDRRALPDPGTMWVESEVDHVAPRSQVEEIVAAICATVLNVEKLGMYDNFFELGGHSLLITQIISRLRMAFQMEIPMQSVLKTPNVAGLAKQIEEIQRVSLGLQSLPLLPAPRDQHIPLSFAQQRLWFIEQLEPGNSLYNTPAYVRLRGSLDITVLQCSISEIVRRHEVLRTTFVAEDGQAVQVIQDAALVLLPVIDVSGLSGEEREAEAQRLAQADVQMPFDLSVGPLLRVQLVRLHEREHVMLVTMHHIITDGWSMGILLEEVSTLYTAFVAGQPSPLPDLPIQYADFAVWQRAWFQGEMLNAQLAYWKTQLADAPTVLELPTDRARPAVKTYHGAHHVFALPEALSQGLNVLSRQEGVTLFMTLLAGFQVLLARYTGVEDLVVGVPIANRNRVETEALIGFFVNTLVLRGDLRENPSFRELLARTRAVALGAYAHQDLPFEVLVEALQPKRSLSHSPLFQVMFVLQNQPVSGSELPGIQMEPMLVESSLGKFDMTLSMVENGSRLEGTLEYDTDLFDASTISR
ncbi:non-ribosomal peptide synthetase, partial [Dictyobacter arantiisoli]